jgi:peptidoglycan/LPS O-acetylase OafA/YrhL
MPSQEGLLDSIGGGGERKQNLSMRLTLRNVRNFVWPKNNFSKPEQLRPTAWLDGLRGFAAFIVYWHHHQLWTHQAMTIDGVPGNVILERGYGYEDQFHFATFYGIRNFITGGHMAVAIFYVISGYVLAAKPLSLIQTGEHLKVGDNLASALFRRWFRLYIPLIVTTFLYITSWHLFGIWNAACEPKSTYAEEVWNWYVEFKNFSFIFKEGHPWVSYNQHLWSIALEMRGSIIIYTVLLALSRATTKARLWCEFGLIVYFLYITDGYYGALFVSGMLQCDLDSLARRSPGDLPWFLRRLEPYKQFIYWHLFWIGIFLAGVPSQSGEISMLRASPGWYWLSYLKPQAVFDPKWFYLFFAANFLIASIHRLQGLKKFFETRFCLYLGRISFSLYLVHGPVLLLLGDRLYSAVGWVRPYPRDQRMLASWLNIFPLPMAGPFGLEISFLLPHLILLPFTIWVADVVTRTVDDPALRISARLYKMALGESPQPPKQEHEMRLA